MATDFDFNPLTGDFDLVTVDGSIPQLSADPVAPVAETAWVRKTGGTTDAGKLKTIFGLGFPLTTVASGGPASYELRYRTSDGVTVGVALS